MSSFWHVKSRTFHIEFAYVSVEILCLETCLTQPLWDVRSYGRKGGAVGDMGRREGSSIGRNQHGRVWVWQ